MVHKFPPQFTKRFTKSKNIFACDGYFPRCAQICFAKLFLFLNADPAIVKYY